MLKTTKPLPAQEVIRQSQERLCGSCPTYLTLSAPLTARDTQDGRACGSIVQLIMSFPSPIWLDSRQSLPTEFLNAAAPK